MAVARSARFGSTSEHPVRPGGVPDSHSAFRRSRLKPVSSVTLPRGFLAKRPEQVRLSARAPAPCQSLAHRRWRFCGECRWRKNSTRIASTDRRALHLRPLVIETRST
jgi:hypothetical protein